MRMYDVLSGACRAREMSGIDGLSQCGLQGGSHECGDESPEPQARIRWRVSDALGCAGGSRRVSGTSLLALICAAALAPVAAAGMAAGRYVNLTA